MTRISQMPPRTREHLDELDSDSRAFFLQGYGLSHVMEQVVAKEQGVVYPEDVLASMGARACGNCDVLCANDQEQFMARHALPDFAAVEDFMNGANASFRDHKLIAKESA